MNSANRNISQKLKSILNNLCNKNINELTDLFYDRSNIEEKAREKILKKEYGLDKFSKYIDEKIREEDLLDSKKELFNNQRKKIERWLKGENVKSVQFRSSFSNWKISNYSMENKSLFVASDFLDLNHESFEGKLHKYIKLQNKIRLDGYIRYKYIYAYDELTKTIDFYEVEYFEEIAIDKIRIQVNPPSKLENKINVYKGSVYYKKNIISFIVENDDDILTILFNQTLKNASLNHLYHENLYGIATGIDNYTRELPKSKKMILREEKIRDIDLPRIYLLLNEMEILTANENKYFYEESNSLDVKHLAQYRDKISHIDSFFSNIKNSQYISTSFYYSLVFREFHSVYKIFKKLADKRDYYVQDRKRVFSEFLNSVIYHKATSCSMILPAFINKSNVFLYRDVDNSISIKEKIFALEKQGIKVDIIFVINSVEDCKDSDFKDVLNEFQDKKIDIRFILKKHVENKVNSFDFFFDNSEYDFVVTKEHKVNYKVFDIRRQLKSINNHKIDYEIIKKQSFSYEELLQNKYNPYSQDLLLDKLIGKWHSYSYGSVKENGSLKLWKTTINIKSNYEVSESLSKVIRRGVISTENSQCLISLLELDKEDPSYILFDTGNNANVLITTRHTKQILNSNNHIIVVGVLSRKELSDKEIKELLDNPNDLIFKIPSSLKVRVDKFIYKNSPYNS